MSPIERLPAEIVQYIAELCTWDSAPPENGFVSEIDLQRYMSKGEWHLASPVPTTVELEGRGGWPPKRHYLKANGVLMPESTSGFSARALDQGNEKIAEKLVAHGAYRLKAGLSALPLAKAKGFHGIVETLFQRNDPTTLVGKLHIGASSNDLKLVAQCLKDPRVEVNVQDLEKNTALHLAVKSAKGDLEVIKLILRHPRIQVSIPGRIGDAPIHLAALNGRMDIVRLLAAMPDFNINCRTYRYDTVLLMAAQAAGLETFTYFLNHPDLENPRRADLYDLVRIVSRHTDDDVQAKAILQLLLRAGHQLDPTCFSINDAIDKGNLLTASKLLSLISQDKLSDDRVGLLQHALVKHHPLVTTLIGELLARDVDIERLAETWEWERAPGDCTARPLFFATVFAENPDCMKMLLEAGANATSTVLVQWSVSFEACVPRGRGELLFELSKVGDGQCDDKQR
ncbi:unnamed protein product, partial [Clonostachys rosea f. rosea IK726]